MRKLTLLAFAILAAAPACRGSGGDDTAATPDSSGTVDPNDTTIQEIQNDAMPSGTAVKIKGVVVTAIDNFGAKKGDIWVEEPGGGPYSGVHVFGAPLDQVNALAVGDIVDIDGAQKDDFHYNGNMGSGGFEPGYAITELKPVTGGMMSVTKVMSGTPITPDVVDAVAIGQMTDYMARDAEWEKWEGVLIKLNNVSALSPTDYVSSKCPGTMCPDDQLKKFDVTGDVVVESALSAMPTSAVANGDCFTSVTGVVDYFFDYQILPRSTDEIGTGGTSCPTENTAATCGDGVDNDGNGFKDCADKACVAASATCSSDTTIEAIQTATAPPTGGVKISSVCVVAQSRAVGMPAIRKNLWVQTSDTTATLNNGLYIFGPGSDLSAFTPGTKVNVAGSVKEFNDGQNMGTGTLTELSAATVTAATGTCTPTPLLNQSAMTLSMDQNGEPAESVYVELKNVTIKTAATAQSFGVGTMTQAGFDFKFDDDSFQISSPATTCYASIKGIWSYQVYDNAWYFLPTEAGTPCP